MDHGYDDDANAIDQEWAANEERKLARRYNCTTLRVVYNEEQDATQYYCECCEAECNTKKIIESHLSGARHKKKYEEHQACIASGKPPPEKRYWGVGLVKNQQKKKVVGNTLKRVKPTDDQYDKGSSLKKRCPDDRDIDRDRMRGGHRDRPRFGREEYFDRSRDVGRGPHMDPRIRGAMEPPMGPRGMGSRLGSDGFPPRRQDPSFDQGVMDDRPPNHMGPDGFTNEMGPRGFGANMGPGVPMPMGPGVPMPMGPSVPMPMEPEGSGNGLGPDAFRNDVDLDDEIAPARISSRLGPDATTLLHVDAESLGGGGSTGQLLRKLAGCVIRQDMDADLAMTVSNSLVSSLREFYFKRGELKVAELLMTAELNLNTLKAMKVGLRLLDGAANKPSLEHFARSELSSEMPPPPMVPHPRDAPAPEWAGQEEWGGEGQWGGRGPKSW